MHALTTIWFRPRETVRDESVREPWLLQLAIVWAWGAAYAFERSLFENTLPDLSFGMRLAVPLVIGLFGGAFYFWTMSIAIELTTSWFKGRATVRQIRRALIVGAIPKALSLIFFVLLALMLDQALLGSEDTEPLALGDAVVTCLALLAILVLAVWSIIATSKALAEVQGFQSAWKAWLHYVVAFFCVGLVMAIPILLWLLMWKT